MANFFDQFDSGPAPASGSINPYGEAIASVESKGSGNYRAVGPTTKSGDRALGRYQVMSENVRPWSKEILGREVTPSEFMQSPELQDQIFNGKFGQYVEKYGPEGASRAWFAGEKGMHNPNARDILGTTVDGYSRKFTQALGYAPEQARGPQVAAAPQAGPATPQGQQAGNFFDQFDAAPAQQVDGYNVSREGGATRITPTVSERFPAPQAEQPGMRAALEQRASQMRGGDSASSPGTSIALDFMNQGSAAGQGTTPNIGAQMRNLISTEVHESDSGEVLYRDPQSGQIVPTDQNKHVALRDPSDGKIKIFARTASTDEGRLSAGGRILMTGMATGTPTARATSVLSPTQSAHAPTDVVAAASRVSQATELPVNVPRAFASDSIAVQRAGQMARNVPIVGDSIPRATGEMVDQLGDATQRIAASYGQGSGPNVANRIGQSIGRAAESETAAATNAARQSDEAVLGSWQGAQDRTRQGIETAEQASLTSARQAVGDMSPQDMGQAIISRLRAGEQAARSNKEALYGAAGNSDASIQAGAVQNLRSRVAQSLENDGWRIDGILTPASSRMMDELQNLSSLRIPNKAVGARLPGQGDESIAAVNMQGIESSRKVLNRLSQAATNDADRTAARHIIREFDNWLSDAFDTALYSGSDQALNSFRAARAANAEWRTRFGFNARDDADRVINKIVTGEVTPQEVSNWIVGASKVGSKGVSSRLLTRLTEATGGDQEAMQAIRGGVWNRLSQATDGVTGKAPQKVADDISEFLNGSGRDVANRLFTDQQRTVMSTYADTLRRGQAARQSLADVAATTKPGSSSVGIGPMQELANTVLGKSGKADEAIYAAIDAYAKSGGRGDIATLAQLVRNIPATDKGDLAGSIIRRLGQSPRTGEFSPDVFVSQWQSYTPQAKAILFGNAGPHRQALDDIATISQRYKEVGRRFGNPSGTGQTVAGLGLVTSVLSSPYIAVPSLIGGAVFARILSAPAGASSAAKWGKAYSALQLAPTAQKAAAFEMASRNLANTARDFGSTAGPVEFMRLIQGGVPARAEDE